MRNVKKRIKGNRIINLLEVMLDETSFSIVSANATIKLMTKAGILPSLKQLKSMGTEKPVHTRNTATQGIIEFSPWVTWDEWETLRDNKEKENK